MIYRKMKLASCIVFNNYNLAVKKERDKWHKVPILPCHWDLLKGIKLGKLDSLMDTTTIAFAFQSLALSSVLSPKTKASNGPEPQSFVKV